jgi:hypothetical protein
MYLPTVLTVAATVPWVATYFAEESSEQASSDFIAIAYLCAVGLLISLAALVDDVNHLTAWFGIISIPDG